ncbi:MAG: biotin--[acetyl-CoA-carboxylase] ligase [Clostridiales bacterium]|nr:biotin--[acetyl-CoA-carboxylase] ligase [Clostridiales bacterium]
MSTKENVLTLLIEAGGSMTGEAMARRLGLSRMAVCKGVEALRQDGYVIDAKTKGGYTLHHAEDILIPLNITKWLHQSHEVIVLDEVDSTNTYLRDHPEFPDGMIVTAKTQTGGKGRRGNSFHSPVGSGVYFSLLIKKALPLDQMWALTFIAAIATARTLREAGADAQIKWVNDVYIPPKKICGILTEVTLDAEARMSTGIVVGIGINLKKTERPAELQHKITSLEEAGGTLSPGQTIAGVINHFDALFKTFDLTAIVQEYKSLCFVLGEEISFVKNGISYMGTALDILPDGNLLVETKEGRQTLSSGEISILPQSIIHERDKNNGNNF